MTGEQRRARLDAARLYLVTDGLREDLDEFLAAVLAAGVDVVQLRDKHTEAKPLLERAARFRAACEQAGALFIINDRADLALAAGADGLHVGQDDLSPAQARTVVGEQMLIGRSTHSVEQMRAACEEPADYVCVGPLRETPTKPGRPATGFEIVSAAARECSKPWFAIGGLDAQAAKRAAAEGARRIVVVRAIGDAADPQAAVRELRAAVEA